MRKSLLPRILALQISALLVAASSFAAEPKKSLKTLVGRQPSVVTSIRCDQPATTADTVPYERYVWHVEPGTSLPAEIPTLGQKKAKARAYNSSIDRPQQHYLEFEGRLKDTELSFCDPDRSLMQRVKTEGKRLHLVQEGIYLEMKLNRDQRMLAVFEPSIIQNKIHDAQNRPADVLALVEHARSIGAYHEYMEDRASMAQLDLTRSRGLKEFEDQDYAAATHTLQDVVRMRSQLELPTRDFEVDMTLAKLHYQQSNYGEAANWLRYLLGQHPGHPEIVLYQGLVDLQRGRSSDAIRYLESAADHHAQDAHFYLGFALIKVGDHPRALNALKLHQTLGGSQSLKNRAAALIAKLETETTPSPGLLPDANERDVASTDQRPQRHLDSPTITKDSPPIVREPGVPPGKPSQHQTPHSSADQKLDAVKSTSSDKKTAQPKADPKPAGKSTAGMLFARVAHPEATVEGFRGKPTILHFWASWCPPCRPEMKSVASFYETVYPDLSASGVRFITVNMDFAEEKLRSFLTKEVPDLPSGFPVFWDPNWGISLSLDLDKALPKTVLLDRDGKFQKILDGRKDWQSPEVLADFRRLASESSQ